MPKTCPQCQNVATDDANNCPSCGAALNADPTPAQAAPTAAAPGVGAPTQAAPAGPAVARSGSSLPPFAFDLARLNLADMIAAVASFVLLISLFLSWFGVTVIGIHLTASGTSAHGWLWLVFIICLAILAYMVCIAGWGNLPFAPQIPHLTAMIAATVANLVLVFIAFIDKPGGSGVGWEFGAFLALIAAVVAAAPYAIPQLRARTMK
jgi:hypothetical protein